MPTWRNKTLVRANALGAEVLRRVPSERLQSDAIVPEANPPLHARSRARRCIRGDTRPSGSELRSEAGD